ncbi:hypothetical protein DL771_012142 [Monosporascus sp. 5C6A]|nr:hypothetical protein DL771_012142 [Monosporascus sp. 5C6A]
MIEEDDSIQDKEDVNTVESTQRPVPVEDFPNNTIPKLNLKMKTSMTPSNVPRSTEYVQLTELVHNGPKNPKDSTVGEIFSINSGSAICGGSRASDEDGGAEAEGSKSEEIEGEDEEGEQRAGEKEVTEETQRKDNDSLVLSHLLLRETVERGRPKGPLPRRHPDAGRAIPAMAIKFVHHKGCGDELRPTIFYFTPTRKLIFCAVSLIIGLAPDYRAFHAPA